ADRVDDAGDLVPGDAWKREAGPAALLDDEVAMTDPAGLHAHAHLAGAGIGDVSLEALERRPGLRHGERAHLRHGSSSFRGLCHPDEERCRRRAGSSSSSSSISSTDSCVFSPMRPASGTPSAVEPTPAKPLPVWTLPPISGLFG